MPFTFIIVGLYLIIVAAKGNASALFTQLQKDFIPTDGSHGFVAWAIAMLAVGALGYVPQFRTFSRAFLVLLIAVLFLANKGFFAKLQTDFPHSPATRWR